jgi:hypothetical protein
LLSFKFTLWAVALDGLGEICALDAFQGLGAHSPTPYVNSFRREITMLHLISPFQHRRRYRAGPTHSLVSGCASSTAMPRYDADRPVATVDADPALTTAVDTGYDLGDAYVLLLSLEVAGESVPPDVRVGPLSAGVASLPDVLRPFAQAAGLEFDHNGPVRRHRARADG